MAFVVHFFGNRVSSNLPDKKAKTIFVDPEFIIDKEFHTRLNEIGFRRSGAHLYRPHCDNCEQCIPSRVLVNEFNPGQRFRRVLNKNKDLIVNPVNSIATEEHFNLYKDYINARHSDGDMHPPSREQYQSFLLTKREDTLYLEMRHKDILVGVMICDRLLNALSSVFTFFDPTLEKRSLGTFAILWQIKVAKR
ncbi:arginyltransferase, partial [Gammaproteobacteria bacterium]|nr:arginyltransferase [Gammaproteobacteria bacterium]